MTNVTKRVRRTKVNDNITFDRNTQKSTVTLRCISDGTHYDNHSSYNCSRTLVCLPLPLEASLPQLQEDSNGLLDFGDFQEHKDQVRDLHLVDFLFQIPRPKVQIFMELVTIRWTQSLMTSTASAHRTRSQDWSALVDLQMLRRHGITANGERWMTFCSSS